MMVTLMILTVTPMLALAEVAIATVVMKRFQNSNYYDYDFKQ